MGQIRRDQRRVLQEQERGVGAAGDSSILIVSGPPGVGKTTAAALLAARSERAVHLEADTFFSFIRSDYIEPWRPESHDQNATVMGIVARAAAGYASAGYLTIVDGIVIPGWFFEPLRDALLEEAHSPSYAVLRAPLPVCLGRVQGREGDPPVEAVAIEQIWRSFADLGELESNALEVDGLDAHEVSELLARRLSEGSLRA